MDQVEIDNLIEEALAYDSTTEFFDNLLSQVPLLVGIGLAIALFYEYSNLRQFITEPKGKTKKRDITLLKSFRNRILHIALGVGMITASFSIINTLIETLAPENLMYFEPDELGSIGVLGMILTGICLILSAGNSWLVKTAQCIATVTILIIILIIFEHAL